MMFKFMVHRQGLMSKKCGYIPSRPVQDLATSSCLNPLPSMLSDQVQNVGSHISLTKIHVYSSVV